MSFIESYQQMNLDAFREEIITMLQQAYTDGRISVETLERRLSVASAAQNKEELIALISDIPAGAKKEKSWRTNKDAPRRHQLLMAVMGSSERSGNWQPARKISSFCLMGAVKIDLRNAEIPSEGIQISCLCIMGGLTVIVPPGIKCEVSGLPLMGGFENKTAESDPDAPTVRVTGICLMGGVEVKSKNKSGKKK